jgi:glutamate racemase
MIGISDSGSGGLTVLKEIRKRLPKADIVYFGDIKNAPYGVKSSTELTLLTVQAIELLQKRGAQNIVSACNSVSATLAISSTQTRVLAPKNLIEMVDPTVAAFKDSSAKILLVATPATIGAEIYQHAFRMIGKEIATVSIEKLAGEIEFGESERVLEHTIRNGLTMIDLDTPDTLILGCTHYPFVRHIFERVVPHMKAVDPAVAVAERVREQMNEEGNGTTTFLISKDSEPFRARVRELELTGEVSIEILNDDAT